MQVLSSALFARYPPYRLPTNEAVAVVGQVLSLDESNRKLVLLTDLQSNVKIEVNIPQNLECAQLRNIKYLQVRGFTESSHCVILKQYCNFKDNFDLKAYNEVLKLSTDSNFRSVFGLRM